MPGKLCYVCWFSWLLFITFFPSEAELSFRILLKQPCNSRQPLKSGGWRGGNGRQSCFHSVCGPGPASMFQVTAPYANIHVFILNYQPHSSTCRLYLWSGLLMLRPEARAFRSPGRRHWEQEQTRDSLGTRAQNQWRIMTGSNDHTQKTLGAFAVGRAEPPAVWFLVHSSILAQAFTSGELKGVLLALESSVFLPIELNSPTVTVTGCYHELEVAHINIRPSAGTLRDTQQMLVSSSLPRL